MPDLSILYIRCCCAGEITPGRRQCRTLERHGRPRRDLQHSHPRAGRRDFAQRRLARPGASAVAHSKLCGSTVTVDLSVRTARSANTASRLRPVFGQASAAVMAREIVGSTPDESPCRAPDARHAEEEPAAQRSLGRPCGTGAGSQLQGAAPSTCWSLMPSNGLWTKSPIKAPRRSAPVRNSGSSTASVNHAGAA